MYTTHICALKIADAKPKIKKKTEKKSCYIEI